MRLNFINFRCGGAFAVWVELVIDGIRVEGSESFADVEFVLRSGNVVLSIIDHIHDVGLESSAE